MSRRLRAVAAAVGAIAPVLLAVPTAGAATNPAHNINASPTVWGSVCDSAPTSVDCRTRLIAALNHARSVTGKPAYALPDRFSYLSPREKLLVLSNQDRLVQGLGPIRGLNYWLNRSAQSAVPHRTDPAPVARLGGAGWTMWSANWASGNGASANGMFAYYNWMYYDGLNPDGTSWNLACHPWDRSLCWKHRQNVLVAPGNDKQLVMGVGAGSDGHGWYGFTQLFQAFPASAPIGYVPTVVRVSSRSASHSGGKVITLGGFGFVGVTAVTVLGSRATVLSHDAWHLTVRVPAHKIGRGYLVVHTTGGTSSVNYAAGFSYV